MELLFGLLEAAFLPLEVRPLSQQKVMLQEQEAKFCQWITRGDGEWCHFHFHFHALIFLPVNPGYETNSVIYWTLIQSIHSFLENFASALQSIVT